MHPPASRGDPWLLAFPATKNYIVRPKNGVFQVYASPLDVENDKPIKYNYPDLPTFVRDTNILCSMIADGPL